jgi:hypothetical protein
MKKAFSFVIGLAAVLLLISWNAPVANAWCDPGELLCGAIVDSNMTQGHDDISDYNCNSSHWNGRAHVYRVYASEDSLLITLNWSASNDDRLRLFLLADCNQNHCLADGADTIAINVTPGQDYWIIVESKRDNNVAYELQVICSDHPLPVQLTAFDAVSTSDGVQLTWSVASEVNNSHFEIEREQPDVTPWEHVGTITGRGTNPTEQTYTFVDHNVAPETAYIYRLFTVDNSGSRQVAGTATVNSDALPPTTLASGFELIGNYPNPFNPSTTIRFDVAEQMQLSLDIFDVTGRLISTLASGMFETGMHEFSFDASTHPSGVYFARLSGETDSQLLKMVLMK